MSRIDELQRLHEAAMAQGSCGLDAIVFDGAARREWPAIHCVLVAARRFLDQANVTGAISYGPNQEVELTQYADTYDQLREALRALDGGA